MVLCSCSLLRSSQILRAGARCRARQQSTVAAAIGQVPTQAILQAAFGHDWKLVQDGSRLHSSDASSAQISSKKVLLVSSSTAISSPRLNEISSHIQRVSYVIASIAQCGSSVVHASILNGICDVEALQQAVNVAKHVGIGAVVGCGGGGVLDAAKALSMLCQSALPARESLLALERKGREIRSKSKEAEAISAKRASTTLLASTPGAKVDTTSAGALPERSLPCVLVPSCPSGAEANDSAVVHLGAGALVPVRPVTTDDREQRRWMLMQATEVQKPGTANRQIDWTDPGTSLAAPAHSEPVPVIRPDGSVGLSENASIATTLSNHEHMLDLPPGLAVASGLTVLAHSIESYMNLDGSPRTRALALAAAARCAVAIPALSSLMQDGGPTRAWRRERAADTAYGDIMRLLAEASVLSGAAMRYSSAGAVRALAMAASARFELGYSAVAAASLLPVLEATSGMVLEGMDEFEEDFESSERLAELENMIHAMKKLDVGSDAMEVDAAWKDSLQSGTDSVRGSIQGISDLVGRALPLAPTDRLRLHELSKEDFELIASGAEATDEMGHSCVELTRQDLVEVLSGCSGSRM